MAVYAGTTATGVYVGDELITGSEKETDFTFHKDSSFREQVVLRMDGSSYLTVTPTSLTTSRVDVLGSATDNFGAHESDAGTLIASATTVGTSVSVPVGNYAYMCLYFYTTTSGALEPEFSGVGTARIQTDGEVHRVSTSNL